MATEQDVKAQSMTNGDTALAPPKLESTPPPVIDQDKEPKKEKPEASKMLEWIYRLGRDPSLYRRCNQPLRKKMSRVRQEMKSIARLKLQAKSDLNNGGAANGTNGAIPDSSGFSSDEAPSMELRALRSKSHGGGPKTRRDPVRRRRRKARGASPTHFLIDAEEQEKHGPDFTLSLPARSDADRLLRPLARIYHSSRVPVEGNGGASTPGRGAGGKREYSSLETLLSLLRKPLVTDNWSAAEVAMFEVGVCEHGKDFGRVARGIPGKTTGEVVNFYYSAWKYSLNHQIWASHGLSEAERSAREKDFVKRRAKALAALRLEQQGNDGVMTGWASKTRSNRAAKSTGKKRKRRRRM